MSANENSPQDRVGDGLKQEATRRKHWAYILAILLQEVPDLCNMLQKDLERARNKIGLDEREATEDFASVLDYVLQEARVEIEDDLSDLNEHEQGEVIYERLSTAISTN